MAVVPMYQAPMACTMLARKLFFGLERKKITSKYTLTECIIFAVIIFFLLVVPGHILNRKKNV